MDKKNKKIGIIGAMESEVELLKQKLNIDTVVTRTSMDFYCGKLQDVDVVVVKSGVGKVNAALCAQLLADTFQVTHIINTGVAGSLNATLDIGDILVSRDAVHHDVDVTIFGYRPGEVPSLGIREFPADEAMMTAAVETCKEINPDISVRMGRVASGDQFISSKEAKERIIDLFAGDCAEMEGASIAQTAFLNHLPFVIIRAISDKADDSAEMDYPSFELAAAKHSAALVEHMITRF